MAKEGKEETDAMFKKLAAAISLDKKDASTEDSPAAAVLQHTWIVGYEPGREFVGFQRSALPSMLALMHGEVMVLAVDPTKLQAVWKSESHGPIASDTLAEKLFALSKDDLKQLITAGVTIFLAKVCEFQCLYCPTSWILIEMAMPKSMLVYGVKKSWCSRSTAAALCYNAAIGLMEAGQKKKGLEKYTEVAQLMQADGASA